MHWAVSQSLLLALSHRPITEVAPQPDLGFIYRPLREFFRHRDRNLAKTLKQLAVLEARFQRLYLWEEGIDQTHLFDTSTDFYDRATTTPPQDLAHFLTDCDIAAFCSLDPQSIISEGPYLRQMHRRWDRLCGAAQEVIAVESRLGPLLADLAEASLLTLLRSQLADTRIRNYVLDGTSTACALYFKLYEQPASMNLKYHTSLFSSTPTGITSLTGKRTAPSLPFLPPHIRQLRHDTEKAVSEIYSFVLYKDSRVSVQAQSLEQREFSFDGKQLSWSAWTRVKIMQRIPCLAARRGRETSEEAPRHT